MTAPVFPYKNILDFKISLLNGFMATNAEGEQQYFSDPKDAIKFKATQLKTQNDTIFLQFDEPDMESQERQQLLHAYFTSKETGRVVKMNGTFFKEFDMTIWGCEMFV